MSAHTYYHNMILRYIWFICYTMLFNY